jgi:hypothetical protein
LTVTKRYLDAYYGGDHGDISIDPLPDEDGKYPAGTVVTLQGSPWKRPECTHSGYYYAFVGWDDNHGDINRGVWFHSSKITITMDADKTIAGLFDENFAGKCSTPTPTSTPISPNDKDRKLNNFPE